MKFGRNVLQVKYTHQLTESDLFNFIRRKVGNNSKNTK